MKLIIITTLLLPSLIFAYTVSGILQGKEEVLIKAKSQGQITKIILKEGDRVKPGDILAIIDDQQEQIEVKLAKVEQDSAHKDYLKTSKLKKFVSQEEVLKKKNEYLKKKSIYELKKYNLENTQITSPIEGIVAHQFIKKWETVKSGEKVYEVILPDELIIELDIAAKISVNLKKDQSLSFTTEFDKKKKYQAQIYYISRMIDKSSGTIKVKLKIDNKKELNLMPGALVSFEL